MLPLQKVPWLTFCLSISFNFISASAPPRGVVIDYSFSNSLFVNNADAEKIPRAALNNDFPDPTVLRVNESMYAFGTSAPSANVQIATRHLSQGGWSLWHNADALPRLPGWVEPRDPQVWAPSIVSLNPTQYVLYFSARKSNKPHVHCIGTANSRTIMGPYIPSENPFACHDSQGGAIDASGFYDHRTNTRYVTYKVDGNNFGSGGNCNNGIPPIRSTPIMLQKVDPRDGVTKLGPPIAVLDRSDADGPLIEAPSIAMLGGKYFMFFSSNCYVTDMYDVAYAVADRVEGPYTKRGPLMVSRTFGMHGPGGAEVIANGYREGHLVFHAGTVGQRLMFEGRLEYLGGTRLRFCLTTGECTIAD